MKLIDFILIGIIAAIIGFALKKIRNGKHCLGDCAHCQSICRKNK